MGPETLKLYADRPDLRDGLAGAQHWIVDGSMIRTVDDVLRQLAEEIVLDGRGFVISEETYVLQLDLPADNVVLEMAFPATTLLAHFVRDPRVGRVAVSLGTCRYFEFCGTFTPRSLGWEPPPRAMVQSEEQVLTAVITADLLFALAAEPRLVRKVAPLRQQRRKVQRVVGFVPAVWKNISWTVGETVTPARKSGHPDHGMPLHIVRAHWREYPRQTARAVRRPGRPGWWTWVSHHFRGHPAYGVKLHRYRPKIGEQSSGVIRDVAAAATLHAASAAIKGWKNGR